MELKGQRAKGDAGAGGSGDVGLAPGAGAGAGGTAAEPTGMGEAR